MKIQPRLDSLAPANTAGTGKKGPAPATSKSVDVDQVHLSPLVSRTQAGAATTSNFDAEKVASIKQAIAEGRMTVDSGAIADKLIAQAKALADKARG